MVLNDGVFVAEFDELFAVSYRVAYRLLGSRNDAEDVVQETLTRAYVRWKKVSPYSQAWVAKVAANLSIDFLRKKKNQSSIVRKFHKEELGNSPYDSQRVDLYRALSSLPKKQKEVVVLHYLANLSQESIASLLRVIHGRLLTNFQVFIFLDLSGKN